MEKSLKRSRKDTADKKAGTDANQDTFTAGRQKADLQETLKNDIPGMLARLYEIPKQDMKSYSPLTLAYIGDAVFELLIRSVLVQNGNTSVNKLNKAASRIECAPRQSAMIKAIRDDLTETEKKIYKRGRNAKSATKAKNATTAEYRRATGLEAVIGYLYLSGDLQRAAELVKMGIERTIG